MLPHLRLAGAHQITIDFYGQGDSGEIQEISCNELDLTVKCPGDKENRTYHEMLLDVGYAYLEDKEDWVNNEGGYGSLILNLNQRTIHCEMNIRVTHTEEYEHNSRF